MTKSEIIAGLDMGSGRVTVVVGTRNPEAAVLKILSGVSLPCRGLKGGVVVDIKETAHVVSQAIEQAEKDADAEVRTVYMGLRGVHLQSLNSHGAYNIARTDKEITCEDVQFAIENAKAVPISSDREIIHVIPQSFSIDRQKGVPNPEGMEGSLLEVDVHIVTASSSHLNNLVKPIAKAGFDVQSPLYGLVALGDCVLTAEEKDMGALLIDIGGESMSVAIYVDGGIKFSKDVPFGADVITRDIAYGLHTSRETARMIKEKYGIAAPVLVGDDEEIPVPSLDRKTSHNVKTSFLLDIIQPRVEELFDKVREEVQKSRYSDMLGICVLTGGGSQLRGINDICAQIMAIREVRQATVLRELVDSSEEFFNPVFSTAMSAALYPGIKPAGGFEGVSDRKVSVPGKITEFFKSFDIFGKDVF